MSSSHVFALALAALLVSLPAYAAETLWTEIIVRVYDSTGAPEGQRRAALTVASSIVSVASVELIWQTCNEPAITAAATSIRQRDNPCERPLGPRELALRILRSRSGDDQARELPLGEALLDSRTGTGVLATVYIDRVD